MTISPVLLRGSLDLASLRTLTTAARDQLLFAEVHTSGPDTVVLTLTAGRLCLAYRRSHPRPLIADHTRSSMMEQNIVALVHVLNGTAGRFYRSLPLTGVGPADLQYTYDARELLEEAIHRFELAGRRVPAPATPQLTATSAPVTRLLSTIDAASAQSDPVLSPRHRASGTSIRRLPIALEAEADVTTTNRAQFASRAREVRLMIEREREAANLPSDPAATTTTAPARTTAAPRLPRADDATADDPSARSGAFKRLIRSLAD